MFIDAPFVVVRDEDDVESDRQVLASDDGEPLDASMGRSWWQFGTPSGMERRPSQSFEYSGIDVSINLIQEAIRKHQIDTILGFSQGAAMAAYFCATQDTPSLGIKRLIAYAGFLPKDPRVAQEMLDRAPIASDVIQSLWVAGTGDELITVDRSRTAAEIFQEAIFHEHSGGHMVPTTKGELKDLLASFLLVGSATSENPPMSSNSKISKTAE